ncbi:hypothetical protein EDD17DRAFT_1563629 [Pisolithus thermaeus]|nr:hypothetical protein EV401DRAFT_813817 [Pisolithus croceorrhizus]KAI6164294.1 hypothetical protein EDD17DRAFT_1563629 [Pisolithus thermaeus]
MPPLFTMLSKRLIVAWAFFTLCLMAAGIVTLVLSIVWRQPSLLRNLTFSNFDLTAGTVLGSILLGTSVLSILLITLRGKRPLVLLNWILLLDGIAILVVATSIWIYTLHERNNYHAVFGRQSNATKIMIQDELSCCGYFSATDEVAFGGTFCPDQAAAIAANSFCVTPIVQFADKRLNNVFSTIYGFMAIVIGLFLSSMCIIKKRQESERFEKIDTKRASRFV